jgi:2-polyprenyl-6-methoxyphenol hydroxylase-like FAD-dependent oxidoreductase
MRVVVAGGGPVGMCAGMIMARQGADVMIVDRDAPPAAGEWQRRGVMQFRHPHFFRPIVREVLLETLPDVWNALLAAGGVPVTLDGFGPEMTGLQCRRSTFERAVWQVAAREPRLALHTGHAGRLLTGRGRVTGVVIDGGTAEADLVIVATGRASRFAADARPPGEGGACGFSYVSRMYRARPGVEPLRSAIPMASFYRGYLAMVFPQDGGTHSALLVRATSDGDLALARHDRCFDAIAPLIPQLAPWTDPARFEPITGVMAGGGLTNSYRGQLDGAGRVPIPGVFFAGDAVCTTNPAAGRGVSLGLRQVRTLMSLLQRPDWDPRDVAAEFDAWCTANIRPWYEDHVYWDTTLLRRFAGEDIDLTARIPSDVVCAAAQVDPSIMAAAGPYLGMLALPSVLDPARERALAVLRTGWRPPWADGPSRDDLAGALRQAARQQAGQPAGV